MNVDTLAIARDLRATELPTAQAEAIAAAIGRSVSEGSATKGDVGLVRTELKADIERFRSELKADIELLRSELKADIELLRSELKAEIERSRNQIVLWLVGTQIALGGLVVAVIKL